MTILISELYGKEIITSNGHRIGTVEDLVLDMEDAKISRLLLTKIDNLVRSQQTARELAKNSVTYDRVKSVSETIIVGSEK